MRKGKKNETERNGKCEFLLLMLAFDLLVLRSKMEIK